MNDEAPKKKSDSIWYPRYIGDYQRKTSHLSLAEHGVYTVLLDHYYSTEKPLPANASRLQIICKAFAPSDIEAMQNVLAEFFVLTADGYRNERADEELSRRSNVREKRREAAHAKHAKAHASEGANAPASAPTATATTNAAQLAESKFVPVSDAQVDHLCAVAEVRAEITDNRLVNDWLQSGLTLTQIERAIRLKRSKMVAPPNTLRFYHGAVIDALKPRSPPLPTPPSRPAKRQISEVMAADQERTDARST